MDNVYVTVTMKNRASLNNDARVLRRQDSISLSIAPKGRAAMIEVYRRKTTTTPSLQVSDLVGFMYVVCNTVHCTPLATAFDIRFRFRDSEVQRTPLFRAQHASFLQLVFVKYIAIARCGCRTQI